MNEVIQILKLSKIHNINKNSIKISNFSKFEIIISIKVSGIFVFSKFLTINIF